MMQHTKENRKTQRITRSSGSRSEYLKYKRQQKDHTVLYSGCEDHRNVKQTKM